MSGRCQACTAETRDGAHLCKVCLRELTDAITTIRSTLHDLSDAALGLARTTRSSSGRHLRPVYDDDRDPDTTPAWLRTRDGQAALPATRLPIDEQAREWLFVALNTTQSWARHLAAAHGLDLAEELTREYPPDQ